MELNETQYRVVGVMGPEFRFPAGVELWVPLGLPPDASNPQNRYTHKITWEWRVSSQACRSRRRAL